MQKGLGIAALVLSIFAVLIPIAGPWLTILVAAMAAFAYGPGLGMAIAAIIINVVHLIFLSPQVWVAVAELPPVAIVLFGPQVAAIVVLVVLHKKHQPSATGAAPEGAGPILKAAPAQTGPTCSSCGAAVQATDVYCGSCGARQAPQRPAPAAAGTAPEGATPVLEAAPAQTGLTCSSCGAGVQATDAFLRILRRASSAAKTCSGSRRSGVRSCRTETRISAGANGTNLFLVWDCCSGYRRLLRILRHTPRRLMITMLAEARCYEKTRGAGFYMECRDELA